MRWRWMVIACVLATAMWTTAQDSNRVPITADNVDTLQSVLTIDFDPAPEGAGEIVSGWLRIHPRGDYAISINRDNDMLLWNLDDGSLANVYTVEGDGGTGNMMDIAWDDNGDMIHSLHTDGANYIAAAYTVETQALQTAVIPVDDDMPVRIWPDENDPNYTWLEVMTQDPNQTPYVIHLDLRDGTIAEQMVSAAEDDRDSQVRIGRMPAPLAVTAELDGTVFLWDLERNELLHTVQAESMPMFGHINGSSGRTLAWRDTMSEQLGILDFETGESQVVAPLYGTYIQALLLTPSHDAIIGVNFDMIPTIAAWRVEDGTRVTLGEHRACSRTPDMVQISEDGSTLMMGCDTGFDVWRVVQG